MIALFLPAGPFADCLDVVDSDPYYETCIYDLCAMLPDDSMLCNHFEQYAQACRNSGERPGDWRATRNQCGKHKQDYNAFRSIKL